MDIILNNGLINTCNMNFFNPLFIKKTETRMKSHPLVSNSYIKNSLF